MQRILKICQPSSSGGDLLEEELVKSGAPEIAIFIYTRIGIIRIILSLQQRKPLMRMFCAVHEQIAATRFVWTIVILSSIEASGPLLNSRT